MTQSRKKYKYEKLVSLDHEDDGNHSKKFVSKAFHSLKYSLFQVINSMSSKITRKPVLLYIYVFLEFAQLSSFPLDPGFEWSDGIFKEVQKGLFYVRLGPFADKNESISSGFNYVFWALLSLTILTLILVGISMANKHLLDELQWLVSINMPFVSITTTTLYIPIVYTLLKPVRCSSDYVHTGECFSNIQHLLQVVLGLLTLILFIPFSLLISILYYQNQPTGDEILSRPIGRFDGIHQLSKTFLVFGFVMIGDIGENQWLAFVVCIISSFASAYAIHTLLPYFNFFYNQVFGALFCVVAWESICLLFVLIVESNSTSSVIFLIGGIPLTIAFENIRLLKRKKELRNKNTSNLSSVHNFELKLRLFLQHKASEHFKRGMNDDNLTFVTSSKMKDDSESDDEDLIQTPNPAKEKNDLSEKGNDSSAQSESSDGVDNEADAMRATYNDFKKASEELNNQCNEWFSNAEDHFSHSALFYIYWGQFHYLNTDNSYVCRKYFYKASTLSKFIDEDFLVYKMKLLLLTQFECSGIMSAPEERADLCRNQGFAGNRSPYSTELLNYAQSKNLNVEGKQLDIIMGLLVGALANEILKPKSKSVIIYEAAFMINELMKKRQKNYIQHSRVNAHSMKLYFDYATLWGVLLNQKEVGKPAFARAKAIFLERCEQVDLEEKSTAALFDDRSAIVGSVCDADGLFRIVYCNENVQHYFGYSGKETNYLGVKDLVPQPFKQFHDFYINTHIQTAKTTILGRPQLVFALHKDGYIFPCELTIHPLLTDRFDEATNPFLPAFIASFRQVSSSVKEGVEEYLVVNCSTAHIYYATKTCPLRCGFVQADVNIRELHSQLYDRKLNIINWISNYFEIRSKALNEPILTRISKGGNRIWVSITSFNFHGEDIDIVKLVVIDGGFVAPRDGSKKELGIDRSSLKGAIANKDYSEMIIEEVEDDSEDMVLEHEPQNSMGAKKRSVQKNIRFDKEVTQKEEKLKMDTRAVKKIHQMRYSLASEFKTVHPTISKFKMAVAFVMLLTFLLALGLFLTIRAYNNDHFSLTRTEKRSNSRETDIILLSLYTRLLDLNLKGIIATGYAGLPSIQGQIRAFAVSLENTENDFTQNRNVWNSELKNDYFTNDKKTYVYRNSRQNIQLANTNTNVLFMSQNGKMLSEATSLSSNYVDINRYAQFLLVNGLNETLKWANISSQQFSNSVNEDLDDKSVNSLIFVVTALACIWLPLTYLSISVVSKLRRLKEEIVLLLNKVKREKILEMYHSAYSFNRNFALDDISLQTKSFKDAKRAVKFDFGEVNDIAFRMMKSERNGFHNISSLEKVSEAGKEEENEK
eukprot:Nk52_evm16s1224 gene=Nk52_evmTU16s1224